MCLPFLVCVDEVGVGVFKGMYVWQTQSVEDWLQEIKRVLALLEEVGNESFRFRELLSE